MTEATQQTKFRDTEEQNTQQRAALLGLSYFDTRGVAKTMPLVQGVLTVDEMRHGRLIPIQAGLDNEPYVFAITTNTPQSLLRQLRERFDGTAVEFALISNHGFQELMLRHDPPKKPVYEDVKIASEGDSETVSEVSKTLETVRSDDVLTYLVTQAEKLGASDIHLECQRKYVRVRLRVDGALHTVATISYDKYRVLQGSISSKANISTAANEAQTGHMQYEMPVAGSDKKTVLNMRIETIPTVYGHDAVLRLFNFDESLLDVEKLGFSPRQKAAIDEVISHPRGMVLVVGPTGSGKSTTLYSIINALNQPTRKILSLEDPVEYSISGISQIPVDSEHGGSFAETLRAVLRLDPDVLMVGEIRDADTARTALQASITGHLVLSTLHAQSAAIAFNRMIDIVGDNPIFGTAIRLIIGQRLVRRLDDTTKQAYEPDEATKNWVRQVLEGLPESVEKPNLDNFQLYKAGASEQNPFGYKGRVVVSELLQVNDDMQHMILSNLKDLNSAEIEQAARGQGMVTLLQDGVLKALKGETTLEEINRVI